MLKIFSFTLLIISFVLISCAKKDDDSSSSSTTYTPSKSGVTASGTITVGGESFSGTYASICADASSLSAKPSDTAAFGIVIVITGDNAFTRELNYFTDAKCTSHSGGWYFTNDNVTDQGALTSGGDVYKISFNQVNQKLLANTTAAKTFFDDLFGSGMDLTVGTTYVGTTGLTYYNLVKSSGTSIYYGNPSGTTYPTDSPEAEYIKQ